MDERIEKICGLLAKIKDYLLEFEKETIEITSLMILNSADGSLEMEPDGKNEGSSYAFKPIDYDTVKNRIEDTLTKLEGEVIFEW